MPPSLPPDAARRLLPPGVTPSKIAAMARRHDQAVTGGLKQHTHPEIVDGAEVQVAVIDIGSLPNATTKSVAHGLTFSRVLRMHGTAVRSLDGMTVAIPNGI